MKLISTTKVLAVAAIVSGVALMQATLSGALTAATTVKPELFTELAFKDSLALPATILASTPQHVKSRIVNHEGSTLIYPYRVLLTENGVTKVLQSSRVVLVNNQSAIITAPFSAKIAGEDIVLSIELPDQAQTISFRTKS